MEDKKPLIFCVLVLALIGFLVLGKTSPEIPVLASLETSSFTIVRQDGTKLPFDAKVAKTKEEQTKGLMFIKKIPDSLGLIFLFEAPKTIAFWMKNTLIPLDMLFILPNGKIGKIKSAAQPNDLTPIPSGKAVIAVIEINGGLAEKLKLSVGDNVESPAIKISR